MQMKTLLSTQVMLGILCQDRQTLIFGGVLLLVLFCLFLKLCSPDQTLEQKKSESSCAQMYVLKESNARDKLP